MENKKFLITGLGVVSAAGTGLPGTLDSLSRGERNGGPVTLFDTPLEYPVFEVPALPEKYYLEGRRTISLALMAVDEALSQAGLENDLSRYRVGVCMGTTVASQLNDLEFYKSYRTQGSAPMMPVERYLKGNLAEFISRRTGAGGPSLTAVNACSSGTDAIGTAMSWLNNDLCDIVIAGGADELNRVPLCGFGSLGIVSRDLCSPFDRDRRGLNLGEGAGVLVIEYSAAAEKRGISSDLFLAGYGAASDSYHLTSPRPDGAGLETAIKKALACAGINSGDIDFVNAHGTATPDNDVVEGSVLGRVFGNDVTALSTKGFTGHTLGAAGGIEAVFAAAALRDGWIPASPGFTNKDDNIPITPVREKTEVRGRYALSTSLAFGGNNAALVIGRSLKS